MFVCKHAKGLHFSAALAIAVGTVYKAASCTELPQIGAFSIGGNRASAYNV